jgi:hypothetical protein
MMEAKQRVELANTVLTPLAVKSTLSRLEQTIIAATFVKEPVSAYAISKFCRMNHVAYADSMGSAIRRLVEIGVLIRSKPQDTLSRKESRAKFLYQGSSAYSLLGKLVQEIVTIESLRGAKL